MSAQIDSRNVWRYVGIASTAFCAISVTACLYRIATIDAVLLRVQKSAREMQSDLNDAKERLARLETSVVEVRSQTSVAHCLSRTPS